MFFHHENLTPEIEAALQELNSLLGLQPGEQEIRVTYGVIPQGDQEIAMLTRSMLQIMIELATQIDVPPQHVTEGRTIPSTATLDRTEEKIDRLVRINSSADKPEDAFTAVNYKDHWFWIDDRDFKTKRAFAFLMILFSLTETGGKEGLPLVTIPAG